MPCHNRSSTKKRSMTRTPSVRETLRWKTRSSIPWIKRCKTTIRAKICQLDRSLWSRRVSPFRPACLSKFRSRASREVAKLLHPSRKDLTIQWAEVCTRKSMRTWMISRLSQVYRACNLKISKVKPISILVPSSIFQITRSKSIRLSQPKALSASSPGRCSRLRKTSPWCSRTSSKPILILSTKQWRLEVAKRSHSRMIQLSSRTHLSRITRLSRHLKWALTRTKRTRICSLYLLATLAHREASLSSPLLISRTKSWLQATSIIHLSRCLRWQTRVLWWTATLKTISSPPLAARVSIDKIWCRIRRTLPTSSALSLIAAPAVI